MVGRCVIDEVPRREGLAVASQRRAEGVRSFELLNLKGLFEKFDIAWDEARSEEIFQCMMSKLEDREQWRAAARRARD